MCVCVQMLIQQQQQGGRSEVGVSVSRADGGTLMKVESLHDLLQSADPSADVLGTLSDSDVGVM